MKTGPFKVSSGVALVSEQEFENFRLMIIERCCRAVWNSGGDNVEFHIAAINELKDEKIWQEGLKK
jgi:hypothetical protein